MMGSTHTYDLPGAIPAAKRLDPGAVEMALNPEEVDMMDSDALQVRFFFKFTKLLTTYFHEKTKSKLSRVTGSSNKFRNYKS